jgi:hypothetical protein
MAQVGSAITELRVDQPLRAEREIRSPNGAARLVMQSDCNLVLYGARGSVLWASGTDGRGQGCFAVFQGDGNLVVYTGDNAPVWASSTHGRGASQAGVLDNGTLQVRSGGRVLWSSPVPPGSLEPGPAQPRPQLPGTGPAREELRAGESLLENQELRPGGRRPFLVMQSDCNLVLYRDTGQPIWASQTHNRGTGCRADFQRDGNLVVYDRGGRALWSSGTARSGADRLRLEQDGSFTLSGAGQMVWNSAGRRQDTGSDLDRDRDRDRWDRNPGRGGRDNLVAGERLVSGRDSLVSDNGRYELLVGRDCEVALFEGQRMVWSIGTGGRGRDCSLTLTRSGELSLQDGRGSSIWSSRMPGSGADRLAVTDDGRVILLRRWTEVWASARARW